MIHPRKYDPATEARINARVEKLMKSMACKTCHGEGVVRKFLHTRGPSASVPCPDCARGKKPEMPA